MTDIQIFQETNMSDLLNESTVPDTLQDLERLIVHAGGDLETEWEQELDPNSAVTIARLFRKGGSLDSKDQVIVFPDVAHFAVKHAGFDYNLDGYGSIKLVLHRASEDAVRIVAFFNSERVELFWLPRLPQAQIEVRQSGTSQLVVDLLDASGQLTSGLGITLGSVEFKQYDGRTS